MVTRRVSPQWLYFSRFHLDHTQDLHGRPREGLDSLWVLSLYQDNLHLLIQKYSYPNQNYRFCHFDKRHCLTTSRRAYEGILTDFHIMMRGGSREIWTIQDNYTHYALFSKYTSCEIDFFSLLKHAIYTQRVAFSLNYMPR